MQLLYEEEIDTKALMKDISNTNDNVTAEQVQDDEDMPEYVTTVLGSQSDIHGESTDICLLIDPVTHLVAYPSEQFISNSDPVETVLEIIKEKVFKNNRTSSKHYSSIEEATTIEATTIEATTIDVASPHHMCDEKLIEETTTTDTNTSAADNTTRHTTITRKYMCQHIYKMPIEMLCGTSMFPLSTEQMQFQVSISTGDTIHVSNKLSEVIRITNGSSSTTGSIGYIMSYVYFQVPYVFTTKTTEYVTMDSSSNISNLVTDIQSEIPPNKWATVVTTIATDPNLIDSPLNNATICQFVTSIKLIAPKVNTYSVTLMSSFIT